MSNFQLKYLKYLIKFPSSLKQNSIITFLHFTVASIVRALSSRKTFSNIHPLKRTEMTLETTVKHVPASACSPDNTKHHLTKRRKTMKVKNKKRSWSTTRLNQQQKGNTDWQELNLWNYTKQKWRQWNEIKQKLIMEQLK